jgi:hypothetical protein
MIRHTILFTLKTNVSTQEVDRLIANMVNLKEKLPGILNIMGGACDFHEATQSKPFTHGFSIDFKDQASLDQFFHDPVTHPVKNEIVDAAVDGYDGIIGFNFVS